MAVINILDCTLRDGGYVNNFEFDNAHTFTIINQIQRAGIDIIECGFVDAGRGKPQDLTRFDRCEVINTLLKGLPDDHNSVFVAMIEYGRADIDELPQVTDSINEIKGIRFSFRKSDNLNMFEDAKKVLAKGYKLFIQPIATETYTDTEILNLIERCNTIDVDSMYIVDTYGSMMREDFRRLYYLFEHNMNPNIRLGFHSHNNLQLSYSNAIDFIEIAQGGQRDIIIDASIYGMGRGAGNLNTELLADYLNKRISGHYEINHLLEVVDEYLEAINQETPWGYSLEHFLSASERCHPNFASFLINKKNLSIVEIRKLIASIPAEDRREFNKTLIEDIYIAYKEESKLSLNPLPESFFEEKTLLLASGKSVETNSAAIKQQIENNNYQTVSLNHLSSHIPSQYAFFTNQSRYDEFSDSLKSTNLIVSSNIKVRSNHATCYVVDYKALYEHQSVNLDNVALLMLSLQAINGVGDIAIAGFDGYQVTEQDHYSYSEYNRVLDQDVLQNMNTEISTAVNIISQHIHITYLTPSLFKQHTKQKIIGVIPSRYSSTRLPGKPLKDIQGLPMVVHVLKRAEMSKMLDEVIVATDDQRIFDVVEAHGGKALMTDLSHNNGSERMYEVSKQVAGDVFVVINGDEALLKPEHIDVGVNGLLASNAPVSILYNHFETKNSPADFKVVINKQKEIMYISRSDIPSDSRADVPGMYKAYHIMSFTKEYLDTYMALEQTPLDLIESHELLRVLENGYKVQGVEVESSAISVDTEEDLKFVREAMLKDPLFPKYKNK